MNTKILLPIVLTIWAISACGQSISVTGKVVSNDGIGIADVLITDGDQFVKTGMDGRYKISTNKSNPFVYYTLPGGYQHSAIQGIPDFYKLINPDKENQEINFELKKSDCDQNHYRFIVIGDPQVSDEGELKLFDELITDINKTLKEPGPDCSTFGIAVGDIVFDRPKLYPDYKYSISKLQIPFYQVIGNHDMNYNRRSDDQSNLTFQKEFGPTHYSFNVGKIHYVVMKDVFYYGTEYMGYITEKQLAWLENDLKFVKPGATVVLSMHIPTVYGEAETPGSYGEEISNSVVNRRALFKMLDAYKVHIFAGHSHTQWNNLIQPNLIEHTHTGACGAWWQGNMSTDGLPRGYTVYEATGDSLQWYFKGFNQEKDDQFKIYKAGSDPKYPESILVNVYNYDPTWKVEWYENDVFKGEMSRYWGKDPLATETFKTGKIKYDWISTNENHHMFKAKPVNPNSKIKVVVTDRFNRTYEKRIN